MAVRMAVRVTPRAKRDAIEGFRDGVLRVRVTVPPADGKANDAVVRLLAKAAGVPRSRVTLVGGERSRDKLIEFDGVDEAALRERLGGEGG